MSEKARLNKVIADYYGFKRGKAINTSCTNIPNMKEQWTYPEDFYLHQCGIPNFEIPDFIQMLETHMKLIAKYTQSGFPREWFDK